MVWSPARAVEVAVVVAILLGVTQSSMGQESLSECWSGVREEDPRPPPTHRDLANMGVFVAQFVRLISVTEVYLCVTEGTGG